jgi:hypothetical protein
VGRAVSAPAVGLLALLAAGGTALAGPAPAPARAQFSSYIDDLPIMPGLVESDQGYAFDLYQGGRLAEARLSGQAEASVVRSFYVATLAQLGWKPAAADPYTYRRGRERLIFLVDPKRAAPNAKAAQPKPVGLDVVFVVSPDAEPAVTPTLAPAAAPAAAPEDDRALF